MEELTAKQQDILDFIKDVQAVEGNTPTLREIAAHFNYKSMNAARDHVQALIRKGYLEQLPNKARALKIIEPLREMRERLVDIPIYGTIPAGFASNDEQEVDGCITVDAGSLGIKAGAKTFALKVRGDSMIGRNICEGDIVVCEHGTTPQRGDVVAALIDNENTLKTFVRENGKAFLQAENPDYPELIPTTELIIQGVVTGLVRKFA